ncbi:MAG TPA: DUF2911 domain-containing protein [Terriglobia bacterium]|nr:DUF2911 domain-containing protein [Terriglobia bacterium]
MKKMFLAVLGTLALAALPMIGYAANGRGTAKITLNGKSVSVEYGKPSLNGRKVEDLLGQLPAGQVWRLGADKSTTFTTSADLMFGDKTVPKGEYSLWARKEADGGWNLVFNKKHGQWGTDHDDAEDLVSVPLKEEKAGKSSETVEITLEKEKGAGEISVTWGNMELSGTFK